MELTTNLLLMIVSEVLFLALVGIIVWLFVIRQRHRKGLAMLEQYKREYADLSEERDGLRDSLQATREQLRATGEQLQAKTALLKQNAGAGNGAANNRGDSGSEVPDREPEQTETNKNIAGDDGLLSTYEQRIENLEKFKELYFELEQRMDTMIDQDKANNEMLDLLQGEVSEQNQLIDELKTTLEEMGKQYAHESALARDLETAVESLESKAGKWQQQLEQADHQRKLLERDVEELGAYKARALELESIETKLKRELIDYRRRVRDLEARKDPERIYGTVRVQEIENLSGKLGDREREIRQLRQECETIALQYEELAMKSVHLASQESELTAEQKAELESLKQKLEQNTIELEHKRAECEMLENYYLNEEDVSGLEKATRDMRDSLEEFGELGEQRSQLIDRIGSFSSGESSDELIKLKRKLTENEALLGKTRGDYQAIREQFVEVVREEDELREQNVRLKAECDELRREIDELREAQRKMDTEREESEKLRVEYARMETRYLDMLEKFRAR